MAKLATVKVRNQFADLINCIAYGKERVILTRRGKALVAIVSIDEIQRLDPKIRALSQLPSAYSEDESSLA